MDSKLKTLILGSLFHDIGKMIQRSELEDMGSHENIAVKFLEKEDIYIENKTEILEIIRNHHCRYLKNANLPPDHLAYIVYEADNIASGLDRRKLEDDSKNNFNQKQKLAAVFNLMQKVNLSENEFDRKIYYPLETLDDRIRPHFPDSVSEDAGFSSKYGALYTRFKNKVEEMQGIFESPHSVLQLLESITSYVPSSTNISEVPDISLYDHLKLTAAIASSMYLFFKENNISNYKEKCFDSNKFRDENVYLIVSADISGIQDFIYTISSKKALKSLRARSFYLELLMENIIDEIFEKLGLCRANLLYSGGGHFYIILPNTKKSIDLLEEMKCKVNRWFLERFSVSLYIEIAGIPASALDLMNPPDDENKQRKNRTGEIFVKLSRLLSKGKVQRYSFDELKELINPDSDLNEIRTEGRECTICKSSNKKLYEDFEGIQNVCPTCMSLVELGGLLGKTFDSESKNEQVQNIIEILSEIPNSAKVKIEEYLELPAFEKSNYLCLRRSDDFVMHQKSDAGNIKRIYTINKYAIAEKMSTHLWLGNYIKKTENDIPADFSELIKNCQGIKRLAVLRADVDDLGKKFAFGFEQRDKGENERYKYITFSRYATLSRQISMFFKKAVNHIAKDGYKIGGEELKPGWLIDCMNKAEDDISVVNLTNTGIEHNNKRQRDIVIVYSGGDDLFAVGAWHDIVEFAIELNEALKDYSNGTLTMSGGIGFFRHDYPIHQMAVRTGILEEYAKNNPGKNSVALFGPDRSISGSEVLRSDVLNNDDESSKLYECNHIYKWDELYKNVICEKVKILSILLNNNKSDKDKEDSNMSKIYKLLELFETQYNEFVHGSGRFNLARVVYYIARMGKIGGTDKDGKEREESKKLKECLMEWANDAEESRKVITALNFIIYMNRKERMG